LQGRVLIIDAYTPEPDQDSGSLRLSYLFECLQQLGYGVSFFADNRGFAGRYSEALQAAGVEVLFNPWIASLQDFFRERGAEFSFVLVSRHYVAANYLALVRKYCPQAKFIFDTVDLHYLREERLAELEDSLPLRRVAAQTKRSELSVIRQADARWWSARWNSRYSKRNCHRPESKSCRIFTAWMVVRRALLNARICSLLAATSTRRILMQRSGLSAVSGRWCVKGCRA
jgi:hypothetical protein